MTKDNSMRKLLADKVRQWMQRVPEADTQAKLAARAKMSQSSIHRVVKMDTEPELATANKLASAFGISISQLLADEDDASSQAPFDLQRYNRLPASEKEKIRAFAEFVMGTYEAGRDAAGEPDTITVKIPATEDERAVVKRVAQRHLTTDSLSDHETKSQPAASPPDKRRRKGNNH
ncbi:helix-turn-helix domain-containing protein [Burkholderia glumae]|uniref:helix-turn-helix domain-containing protein n=1 Tax=Burkholderia glumae TaxID=337 RepID=UPI002151ED96|nr:helix-turn-helix transcriptional regulator [Burkholderia glumae]